MHDDLEAGLRRETTAFAATFTPRPAATIRARGDQHRRRAAALSAVLTLAVLALGAGGAYAAIGRPAHTPTPVTRHSPGGPTPASIRPAPPGSPGGTPDLSSLSCLAGADCWAVGDRHFTSTNTNLALAEHWNGQKWAQVPSSRIPGALSGVACAQAHDCWAIAGLSAEHWDGTRWTMALINVPARSTFDIVAGPIACPSANSCWAVGNASFATGKAGRTRPLAEHWDGRAWSAVTAPAVSAVSVFRNVACASTADCWAVGAWWSSHGTSGGSLTEHWNGSAWTVVPSPATSIAGEFRSVSCTRDGTCVAVGNDPLAVRWTGAAWAPAVVPLPRHTKNAELDSVSCLTGSWCLAVGYVAPRSGPVGGLAEVWNGTAWAMTPAPKPTGGAGGLTSVACTSSTSCWGLADDGIRSVMEHWDGTAWSIVPVRT